MQLQGAVTQHYECAPPEDDGRAPYQAFPLHLAFDGTKPEGPTFGVIWRCAVPALCDLAATVIAGIGFIFVSASASAMLRGWSIGFAALFSVTFLKKTLAKYQKIGLALVIPALCIIGHASVSGDSEGGGDGNKAALGVLLMTLAQFVQGIQLVWEEKVLQHFHIPPLMLVGIEALPVCL